MRTYITAAIIAGAALLASCNTIQGAGRDVSSAGDAVSNAAKDAK